WLENGFADQGFIDWLSDDAKVSFPLSMIDRITPNPSETVEKDLKKLGIEGIDIVHTKKHTNIAAFANTEEAHYLVGEDKF
ncbi:mannitol dehydrogenase family protein, partial [Bifidobacterium longum]|nr:mannitol dehydrogenase family protein [Bifidobacterium longum]